MFKGWKIYVKWSERETAEVEEVLFESDAEKGTREYCMHYTKKKKQIESTLDLMEQYSKKTPHPEKGVCENVLITYLTE